MAGVDRLTSTRTQPQFAFGVRCSALFQIVVQRDSTRDLLKDSIFRDVVDSINPFSVLAPR